MVFMIGTNNIGNENACMEKRLNKDILEIVTV